MTASNSNATAIPLEPEYEVPFGYAGAADTDTGAGTATVAQPYGLLDGEHATRAELPLAYRRVANTVAAYDAKEVAQTVQHMREAKANTVSAHYLRQQSRNRTEQLKRQVTTLAFREGIGADEVAMLAGLLVGAFIAGGFGFGGAAGDARRRERADHLNKYLDRCHARVAGGQPFLPVPFGKQLLGDDYVEKMNAWFTDSFEPKARQWTYGKLAETVVPVSLETLGNYGVAIQLDAFDKIAAGRPMSEVTVSYQQQMAQLTEMAQLSGVMGTQLSNAIDMQMVRMTNDQGMLDMSDFVQNYNGLKNLDGLVFTVGEARSALDVITRYQGRGISGDDQSLCDQVRQILHMDGDERTAQQQREADTVVDEEYTEAPTSIEIEADSIEAVDPEEKREEGAYETEDTEQEEDTADAEDAVDASVDAREHNADGAEVEPTEGVAEAPAPETENAADSVDVEDKDEPQSASETAPFEVFDGIDRDQVHAHINDVQPALNFGGSNYVNAALEVAFDGQSVSLRGVENVNTGKMIVFDCDQLSDPAYKQTVRDHGYYVIDGLTHEQYLEMTGESTGPKKLNHGPDPVSGAPVVWVDGFADYRWSGDVASDGAVTDIEVNGDWAAARLRNINPASAMLRDSVFEKLGVNFKPYTRLVDYERELAAKSAENAKLNSTYTDGPEV